MDRLYSRFPAGSVGLALLVLRLVDGIGLLGEGIHLLSPVAASSETRSELVLVLALGASATLLIVGLKTSWAGIAAAVCIAGEALFGMHHLNPSESEISTHLVLLVLMFFLSSSLALLGPGGYSLDARLSGWRMIKLSSRPSSGKDQD